MIQKLFRSFALTGLVVAIGASAALADTGSAVSKQFTGQTADQMTLGATKTRTEWRDVPVAGTCYRRELRGYRRQCSPPPRPGLPARCVNIPVYVDVPYTCTVIRRVPVEVFDANVVARVNLSYGAVPAGVLPNELFTATLKGDDLSLDVRSSGALIIASQTMMNSSRSGSQINLDAVANLQFFEAAPVLASFKGKIKGLSVVKQKVDIKMDAALAAGNHPVHLLVKRGSAVLVDRVFPATAFTMTTAADGSVTASAPYAALGMGKLAAGKYDFDVAVGFGVPGMKIMNAKQLAGAIFATRGVALTVK